MENFVLLYSGGAMGETPEAQQKLMDAWMTWFASLGQSVINPGSPFGASSTVSSDGSVRDSGAAQLGGYSVISAESLDDAAEKAKGCPVLTGGGSVEIYTALPIS
jgi:hypothetical protein